MSPDVTEDQIREAFENFGRIEKIRLLREKNCAFVNFYTQENAVEARKAMQGAYLGGRPLRINFGKDSGAPPAPPGGGGGFGGGGFSGGGGFGGGGGFSGM
jgi:RNA recognition motif-containing protein